MDNKIKIMIVDDHDFYRNALKLALKKYPHLEVISEVSNGNDFLNQYTNVKPDVVLMDIKMPGIDGVMATNMAMNKWSNVKIIALTMYKERDYIMNMVFAGIKGVLFKDSAEQEIETAINKVCSGGYYYTKKIDQLV